MSTKAMRNYFAYGSNLWRKQMSDRCPDHTILGPGVLRNYRWIISTSGYANIVKSENSEVHGVVFQISESDENSLDHFEAVPEDNYRKDTLLVECAGKSLACLVYVGSLKEEGEPKREYIQRINSGLADSNLPTTYVEKYVRKFIPAN